MTAAESRAAAARCSRVRTRGVIRLVIASAAAASPAAASPCPPLDAALALSAGDTIDGVRCARTGARAIAAVAQVTRRPAGGDLSYEEDHLVVADDGRVLARHRDGDLAAAYHDLANPLTLAAVDLDGDGTEELVESIYTEHRGVLATTLVVERVASGDVAPIARLPIALDDLAADVAADELLACTATWELRGRTIRVRGTITRAGARADRSTCPAPGARDYVLRRGRLVAR